MEPAFEELAAANPSHKWVKVNVDDNPAIAARWGTSLRAIESGV